MMAPLTSAGHAMGRAGSAVTCFFGGLVNPEDVRKDAVTFCMVLGAGALSFAELYMAVWLHTSLSGWDFGSGMAFIMSGGTAAKWLAGKVPGGKKEGA